jgi:hypothetical protein
MYMSKEYFVDEQSVVREIWGTGDTILFIFAGAAAEFALNKAVDWLYFTGRLPSDPLGRLFSTVSYARKIVFAKNEDALKAIDTIAAIHKGVETNRGMSIPDWAYRDVLFLLIDYSIRSFEIMERRLTAVEKEEVFDVFNRVGNRMGLQGLPHNFKEWEQMRYGHLNENLIYSSYTNDLFKQYKKHLGALRYKILIESQILVVPQKVKELLGMRNTSYLTFVLGMYKLGRRLKLDWLLKTMILPNKYKKEIKDLDVKPV